MIAYKFLTAPPLPVETAADAAVNAAEGDPGTESAVAS